jgi:hypothetical protein
LVSLGIGNIETDAPNPDLWTRVMRLT